MTDAKLYCMASPSPKVPNRGHAKKGRESQTHQEEPSQQLLGTAVCSPACGTVTHAGRSKSFPQSQLTNKGVTSSSELR